MYCAGAMFSWSGLLQKVTKNISIWVIRIVRYYSYLSSKDVEGTSLVQTQYTYSYTAVLIFGFINILSFLSIKFCCPRVRNSDFSRYSYFAHKQCSTKLRPRNRIRLLVSTNRELSRFYYLSQKCGLKL